MTLKFRRYIRRVPYGTKGKTYPLNEYLCDCGNVIEANGYNVKRGLTLSCGCLQQHNPNRRTHGCSSSPEYAAWAAMKSRCTNPKCGEFTYYGARGISVHPSWLSSFETFLADMGKRPSPKHSIERQDVDGDYTPTNCYWATREVQANNTRSNVVITYLGRTQTIAQWANEIGIPYARLYYRLVKANWPINKAMEN